jgi:uncharacterized protein (TIGR02646 family)
MRKQLRAPAPKFLHDVWEPWGLEWEVKLRGEKPATWSWRQINGEKVHHQLLPILKTQAARHCSFCDAFPVSPPSNETIEHFRPKSRFPRQAWQWENLFFCCDFCQTKKGEKWEDGLLAPDAPDYEFADYFWPDATSGEILIRPDISPEKQAKAEITLRLYGLNRPGHCAQRLVAQERRSALPSWDIDRFPYRDFMNSEEI